ncbi:MAG: hypothetical protein OXI17_13040, partial [Gammaproteobacteria bacterium]|nr:hypothetical protein [Gammaproteobacteria bacterium]
EELESAQRDFSPLALAAWAGGAAVALLGSAGLLRISGIAALDAMLISAFAYAVLSRFDTKGVAERGETESG